MVFSTIDWHLTAFTTNAIVLRPKKNPSEVILSQNWDVNFLYKKDPNSCWRFCNLKEHHRQLNKTMIIRSKQQHFQNHMDPKYK